MIDLFLDALAFLFPNECPPKYFFSKKRRNEIHKKWQDEQVSLARQAYYKLCGILTLIIIGSFIAGTLALIIFIKNRD